MYQNWQDFQPNNAVGLEDCGEMNAGGVWNDGSCEFPQNYICECDGATPPTAPTWCVTGTDANCGSCGEACGSDEECSSFQQCIED